MSEEPGITEGKEVEESIEEKIVSGEEGGEGEEKAEYLPSEEEEISVPTAMDIDGLEAMVAIDNIIRDVLQGNLDISDAVKRIEEVKKSLIRAYAKVKTAKRGRRRRKG